MHAPRSFGRLPGARAAMVLAAFGALATAGIGVTPTPAAAAEQTSPDQTGAVGGAALEAAGLVVDPDLPDGVPALADNEAAAFVLVDLDSGAVLAARAAHQPLPPASTLKILTALTLLPELDKARVVEGSPEAVRVEGSKVGIGPGLTYSIDLLFKALLLQSGNDAALELANAYGGVDATVEAMNARAAALGAYDTHVINPSGLDEPEQVTSAYDLALIARAALARDDFRTYLLTGTADLPDGKGGTFQIQNENRLLRSYDGAIGVKNGYTTLARHTFVGAAERDGRTMLAVVMRTEGRAEPIAAQLMDWGFAHGTSVEPVGVLVEPVAPVAEVGSVATPPVTTAAPPATAVAATGDVIGGADGPATPAVAGADSDTGLAMLPAVGVVGLGLAGTVAALRVRAVRRERARRLVGRRPPTHAADRTATAARPASGAPRPARRPATRRAQPRR